MEREELYRKSVEDVRHHESLLFDRLNYFLVGSAFLVTAYVTLAVKFNQSPKSGPIFLLAYLIIAAGFYLSASFEIINYLNTRLIGEMQLCIKKLELGLDPHQNESANKVITEDFHSDMFCLMAGHCCPR
jgi:hypothetical protein